MKDLIGTALLVAWCVAVVAYLVCAIRSSRRTPPSDFAAGVAHSMTTDSGSWDYSTDENWFESYKASLEISLQAGNFGRVNTKHRSNSGSSNITTFAGADLRAFRAALNKWRAATAIERQHTAERRKREALMAMKA